MHENVVSTRTRSTIVAAFVVGAFAGVGSQALATPACSPRPGETRRLELDTIHIDGRLAPLPGPQVLRLVAVGSGTAVLTGYDPGSGGTRSVRLQVSP